MLFRLERENGRRRRRSCRVCAEGWRDDIFRVLHNTTHNLHSITNGDDWRYYYYYYYFPSLLTSPGESPTKSGVASSQRSGFQNSTTGRRRRRRRHQRRHPVSRTVCSEPHCSSCFLVKESGRGGLTLSSLPCSPGDENLFYVRPMIKWAIVGATRSKRIASA